MERTGNESKRIKIFIANRIKLIREHSEAEKWHYVNTKENPADYVYREISMDNRDKVERWILFGNRKIPGTLTPAITPEDPELKKVVHVNQTVV